MASKFYVGMAFTCLRLSVPPDRTGPPSATFSGINLGFEFKHSAGKIDKEHFAADQGVYFVLSFHSDGFVGRKTVTIRPPATVDCEPVSLPFHFDAAGNSPQRAAKLLIRWRDSGTHWFDIFLDEELMTRIPLRIGLPH